jgi:hypothetical protein
MRTFIQIRRGRLLAVPPFMALLRGSGTFLFPQQNVIALVTSHEIGDGTVTGHRSRILQGILLFALSWAR